MRSIDSNEGASPEPISPDAARFRLDRPNAIAPQQQRKCPPICPDFVVKLRSPSDILKSLRDKIDLGKARGSALKNSSLNVGQLNMTLFDHFHIPLATKRHWHSFHNAWATYIAEDLNQRLPVGYFAESNVQFGIEIDVAAFEEERSIDRCSESAMETSSEWHPNPPTQVIPFEAGAVEQVEVGIFSTEQSTQLMGAIEIVSPANKDRPSQRDVFVTKCQSYLEQRIGLIIVDIITIRKQSLHQQLLQKIGSIVDNTLDSLYASAYRVTTEEAPQLEIWYERLEVGRSLPTLPLWLKSSECFPLDLEKTYVRTCQAQRI